MYKIKTEADFNDTNKIFELCYKKNEPIFTKNRYGNFVVMNIRAKLLIN